MNTETENKCSICGRKQGRDRVFGYPIGYVEGTLKVGGRATVYQICTKCKRCFIKENPHESNGFNNRRTGKRVVEIQKSPDQSSISAEEIFQQTPTDDKRPD